MRVATLQLFDENISGTGNVWYTTTETFEPLGRGDLMCFSASIFNASGSPTLTVQVEHSADGQNWLAMNILPEVNAAVVSNQVLIGNPNVSGLMFLHFVRMKIQFTAGASPQCRLRLGATIRC